ncbi:MAG: hypothetical protein KDJ50_01055 [Alphaproteobacteria bacterium]|nr:hypothetical protein [Alphaproteobacteria bacterium]
MAEKFIPHAKVVDGILILSLPDADSPVVWQMEVGQAKSSAMEVRPADQNNSSYKLVLKTPRADVLDIASYSKKEDAVRALMTVSEAMENAQGQIRALAQTGTPHQRPYDYTVPAIRSSHYNDNKLSTYIFKPLGYVSSAIILLVILFFLSTSMIGMYSGMGSSSASSSSSMSSENQPISAEDFLEGR